MTHSPMMPDGDAWALRQGGTWGEDGEAGGCKHRAGILLHGIWISLPPAWLAGFADLDALAGYCISSMGMWMFVDVCGLDAPML